MAAYDSSDSGIDVVTPPSILKKPTRVFSVDNDIQVMWENTRRPISYPNPEIKPNVDEEKDVEIVKESSEIEMVSL